MLGRDHCYVEFSISSDDALRRLANIVDALRTDKDAAVHRDDDAWRSMFSDEELKRFWCPDDLEREEWDHFWFSTPIPQHHPPEMPTPPWHFESMIEVILQSDYELVGAQRVNPTTGVIEFDPRGYPYGGTGALRALVRALGHTVTGADDGTGYEAGDIVSPLWSSPSKLSSV